MKPQPSKLRAACRATALSLLTLGALLATVVPTTSAGPSAACTLSDPTSCCDIVGAVCDVDCSRLLDPVCCFIQNPTTPLACCPPTIVCKCPPTVPVACCILNGSPLKACLPCDPANDPLGCCPSTFLNCTCPPTTISLPCCVLQNPTNLKACIDPCDPTQPLTCCPPPLLNCRCPVTPVPIVPCCFVNAPLDPYACGGCNPATTLCEADLCVADGLLILEQDALGGTSRNAYAESRIASITPAPGIYALPPPPNPSPPPTSMVHADAQLAGAQYSNPALLGGLSVSASTVFSRCDMNAVKDPAGLFADTYGTGGAEAIDLSILGQTLRLTALDFELQAFGGPGGATAAWHCDVADLGANPPPPAAVAAICALPISSVSVAGAVTVWINEVKPPVYDPVTASTRYEGSHLHIQVNAGAALVDIYVGYVQVSVLSPPGPAFPAVYLPHGPCVIGPACT